MDSAHAQSALTVEEMQTYRRHIQEAASFVKNEMTASPDLGLVLPGDFGPILGDDAEGSAWSVSDIPHYPSDRTDGPAGRLTECRIDEHAFVTLKGAPALYEGYSPRDVVFPVRMLAEIGIDTLLFVTPVGSVTANLAPSDLVLVSDHINFQGVNPLVGPNVDDWGPRFPDMSEPYAPPLRRLARDVALDEGIRLEQGILFAMLGPNFGTAAEYKMVETLGADLVSMRTVPEVIAAQHMGISVLTLAVVTDSCAPGSLRSVSTEEIATAIDTARSQLRSIVAGFISRLDEVDSASSPVGTDSSA